ncbi:unnamed protein product, partial [Hydatigera taeniaeformis]|uniref:NOT2_3_5 domain-containing protein n=1 Tax=Hydatigena taeniaeformis TaxID=6205 RepID=A0A0R3WT40_HYDTA
KKSRRKTLAGSQIQRSDPPPITVKGDANTGTAFSIPNVQSPLKPTISKSTPSSPSLPSTSTAGTIPSSAKLWLGVGKSPPYNKVAAMAFKIQSPSKPNISPNSDVSSSPLTPTKSDVSEGTAVPSSPSTTTNTLVAAAAYSSSKARKKKRRKRKVNKSNVSEPLPIDLEDPTTESSKFKDLMDNPYGMLGLLSLTKIDSSLRHYAPGFDLKSVDSKYFPPSGKFHDVFTSPLSDRMRLGPQDVEHKVPPEYLISHRLQGRLPADPQLALLTNRILFWIFYSFCSEEAQLVAAKELYNRGWRYHKTKMLWITSLPETQAMEGEREEHGLYICWEPEEFQYVLKAMEIGIGDLDDTPTTYELSSRTINARVLFISPESDQKQSNLEK